MNTAQENGYNPDFNDTYKEAFALSGKAMYAEDMRKKDMLLKTRERTKSLIQKGLNIDAKEYSKIMGEYEFIKKLGSDKEKRSAIEKMPRKDKELMAKALRLRDVIKGMTEEERLTMAEEEIRMKNIEEEIFSTSKEDKVSLK